MRISLAPKVSALSGEVTNLKVLPNAPIAYRPVDRSNAYKLWTPACSKAKEKIENVFVRVWCNLNSQS
jgi:hypothetical protein